MSEVFNGVMRAISSLLGLAMVAFGFIWICQGFQIAFAGSFMFGDKRWALYGALLALVGIGQIVWSNTRAGYYRNR